MTTEEDQPEGHKLPKRRRGHHLERWEVAIVKAMLDEKKYNDQDILAFFTRPTRSINHRLISEIRSEKKHKQVKAASKDDFEDFLTNWPNVDGETGLSLRGDELLVKAREAMIAAVHNFNSAGINFRAEIFITTSMIAWTYLCHAWLKREGVDYRYKKNGVVKKLPSGKELYWELGKCLKAPKLPLPEAAKQNLSTLLEIRHDIEHRSTDQIDDALGPMMQACCINFNHFIKDWFGEQFGLERRLPIALQFVTYSKSQAAGLKKAAKVPQSIEGVIATLYGNLSDDILKDPAFSYRVAYVPIVGNKANSSDIAVQFVKPESDEAKDINSILLKEIDKKRYTATQVVTQMNEDGYTGFKQHHHTALWKELDAKNPANGFGKEGDYKNTWVWFDNWLERVSAHCQEQAEQYLPDGG